MATVGESGAETPSAAEPEASTPSIAQPHLAVQDLSKLVSLYKCTELEREREFYKEVYR